MYLSYIDVFFSLSLSSSLPHLSENNLKKKIEEVASSSRRSTGRRRERTSGVWECLISQPGALHRYIQHNMLTHILRSVHFTTCALK